MGAGGKLKLGGVGAGGKLKLGGVGARGETEAQGGKTEAWGLWGQGGNEALWVSWQGPQVPPLLPPSLGYPDPQKIGRRVWAIGFSGNVHSGMLLTHNCLPANASLVDFSITYHLSLT